MNILFASAELAPARLGGSAESVRLTAVGLARRGHRVGIVTPAWKHAPAPRAETAEGNVAVERFAPPNGIGWRWGSERETSSPRFWRRAADCIYGAAVAGRGADILHLQDQRMIIPGFLAARRLRVPTILTLRGIGLRCPIATCLVIERPGGVIPKACGAARLWSTCGPLYRGTYGLADPYTEAPRALRPRATLVARYAMLAWERTLARRFDRVAYVSRGLAAHYARAFPGEPTILHSPVAPIAPHECAPAWRPPVVLYVGKPSRGKGWYDFVDAAGLVTNFGRERVADFVQLGSAPAVPSPWVRSIGLVSPDGAETWRCRAAVCVVPSRQADALPRTALEAMAHGVPTVGTEAGGIPEALGGHGRLVPAGKPKALAEAITAALRDPPSADQRQKQRDATQEQFGPGVAAAAHERVYAGVLG